MFNFKFKKEFGQNFIFDENLLNSIVLDSGINKKTDVLEIGAGAGTLTKKLCQNANMVVSYEIDKTLKEHLTDLENNNKNLKIVFADALKEPIQKNVDQHSLQRRIKQPQDQRKRLGLQLFGAAEEAQLFQNRSLLRMSEHQAPRQAGSAFLHIMQQLAQKRLRRCLMSVGKQEIRQHGALHPGHLHDPPHRKADRFTVLQGQIRKIGPAGHLQIAEPHKRAVPDVHHRVFPLD